MSCKLFASGVVIASLLACTAVGPDHQTPPSGLPDLWRDAPARSADGPALDDRWWRLFQDPLLDELIEAARERGADAQLALAQVDEAQALLREAHATLFPQFDLGGQALRNRITTTGAQPVPATVPVVRNDFRATLSTAFELDFWGRVRRSEAAIRAQLLSTRFGRDTSLLTITGTVAQAYCLLRALDAQSIATRDNLRLRNETLALVRARARGGIASDLELTQAQGAVLDLASQSAEIVRQRATVLHQLAMLTARPDLTIEPGDFSRIPVPPMPPIGLPSSLLERRPDVAAAEQMLAAATERIGIARAATLPTIMLTGNFGGQSRELSDLLGAGGRIWSIGAGITAPLFDAGRLAARVEQAEARQRQALAFWRKSVETAFREVADGLSNAAGAAEAEDALRERVALAERANALVMRRWQAGHSGWLEVLDAQRTWNEAQIALVRVRQSRLAYSVDLFKALGGGWSALAATGPQAAAR